MERPEAKVSSNSVGSSDKPALMLIDIQYDFLPGGALAVSEGDTILPTVHRLLAVPLDRWNVVIATQDWHPRGHISFASTHGLEPFTQIDVPDPYAPSTASSDAPESDSAESMMIKQTLWPDHCIQDTRGAEIEASVASALKPWTDAGKCIVVRKGDDPYLDTYSPFAPVASPARAKERENMLVAPSSAPPSTTSATATTTTFSSSSSSSSSSLVQILRAHDVHTLVLVGLALDVCVRHAALDAACAGFRTLVVREGSRAVRKEAAEATECELASAGVELVSINGPELRPLLGLDV